MNPLTNLPGRVTVYEVGPRDGLQNEEPVSTDAKVELIDALSKTGVRRIEAVSFVHPKAIPQMADADEVWKRIRRDDSIRYSALVPNLRGAQRALDAGFTDIEVVVSASDTHNKKNVNRSTEESLDDIAVLRKADSIRRVVLNGRTVLDRDTSRYLVGAAFSGTQTLPF